MAFIASIINAVVFSVMGVIVFGISFFIADKLTPVDLWKGLIEEKNIALAIVSGAVALSIGMIVAAAVHG
jgi:uncharacterized membrane protein YjfL (UPF0719 family)